jgi:hypothetical protein
MREVMITIGWGGIGMGELTSAAMVRNQIIAERLGCLDAAGTAALRGRRLGKPDAAEIR